MEIPDDVLQIIKEYAMPLTRPDWRRIHKMPYHLFHISVLERYNTQFYNLALYYFGIGKQADFMYIVFNMAFVYHMKTN